jgi:hypothetical protein
MYKNFNLTEEERQQILESHKSHGYKKPLNEKIYDKEYDVVRGNPDFKPQTGKPSKSYLEKRTAAKQFQQDFQSEFPDPGIEVKPYWEKDQAMPSGDSDIDAEIKRDIKVGDRWDVSKKWYGKPDPRDPNLPAEEEPKAPDVSPKLSKKEELEALEKKINALELYKQEFGLDAKMTHLYYELYAKYKEDLRDFNRGGVK